MIARTEIGEELIRRFVTRDGGRQIVSLGSGLDTRAYRLDCVKNETASPPLKYFEVDVAPSQQMKLRILRENNIKNSHVTYVPVDFAVETFTECLKKNNWKEGERTLFLWEGVTMYLSEEAVHDTFRAVAKCGKGSMIFFDALVCLAMLSISQLNQDPILKT
jgi:methyltransferase (TIGR00027 family)